MYLQFVWPIMMYYNYSSTYKWMFSNDILSLRYKTLRDRSHLYQRAQYFRHHEPVDFQNKVFANERDCVSELIIARVNWTELCVKNTSIYCNNNLKNLI